MKPPRRRRQMIEGWMGRRPRKWLAQQAKAANRIIEVGVWKGRSTLILARATLGTVWAVDHWQGVPADPSQAALYPDPQLAELEFRANVARYVSAGKVRVLAMASTCAARILMQDHGPVFDFVFIDGDHSYDGCKADIEAYRPLVRPGGLLSGHDYKPKWPGVMQAVDEAFDGSATIGPASIWSVRMPEADAAA